MNRRILATAIALGAVVALTVALFVVPVPYAIFSPGPVCDTVGRPTADCPAIKSDTLITVSPASADHPTSSKLGATTVSVLNGEPSIAQAVGAWLSASQAVLPREALIPPGQTEQQVAQQGRVDMQDAQASAVVAAEGALHLLKVTVASVRTGFPAAGVLRVGDVITAIDGTKIDSGGQLQQYTAAHANAATRFTLSITRSGTPMQVSLVRTRDPDPAAGGALVFGIGLKDDPGALKVAIKLDPNAVGGPSAGLMLALGVYDRLTPGALAGDTTVAGTGTIDSAGNVGPIGGIQQKMYAARHAFKASVFLAPAGDCSETKGAIPKGLRVVKVSTLDQALAALAAVRAGNTTRLPAC